jgi:hypothetical protein
LAGETPVAVIVLVTFCPFEAAEIVNATEQVGFGVHVAFAGDADTLFWNPDRETLTGCAVPAVLVMSIVS